MRINGKRIKSITVNYSAIICALSALTHSLWFNGSWIFTAIIVLFSIVNAEGEFNW